MDSERWSAAVWPLSGAAPARAGHGAGAGLRAGGRLRPGACSRTATTRSAWIATRPRGQRYRRVDFEQLEPAGPADAIVASRSLHHVGDLARVAERISAALRPGGALVVAEWAWEHFDGDTARWCFARHA